MGGRRDYSGLMGENKVAFDVKQANVPKVVGNVAAVLPREEKCKKTKIIN